MSSSAPQGGAVHRRTIEFEARDQGDGLAVTARLRDERPWAAGSDRVEHIHDMELTATVRKEDLTITSAVATMGRFPHEECPSITGAFVGLVGLHVGKGYTRAVQQRFGGARGCSHLEQLARTLGPMVVQAMTSLRARDRDWHHLDSDPTQRPSLMPPDTCHVWSEGGVGEQKLAAGWRPGEGSGYPAPAVEVFLRRREAGSDQSTRRREDR
jgi:hypothetical protein